MQMRRLRMKEMSKKKILSQLRKIKQCLSRISALRQWRSNQKQYSKKQRWARYSQSKQSEGVITSYQEDTGSCSLNQRMLPRRQSRRCRTSCSVTIHSNSVCLRKTYQKQRHRKRKRRYSKRGKLPPNYHSQRTKMQRLINSLLKILHLRQLIRT